MPSDAAIDSLESVTKPWMGSRTGLPPRSRPFFFVGDVAGGYTSDTAKASDWCILAIVVQSDRPLECIWK